MGRCLILPKPRSSVEMNSTRTARIGSPPRLPASPTGSHLQASTCKRSLHWPSDHPERACLASAPLRRRSGVHRDQYRGASRRHWDHALGSREGPLPDGMAGYGQDGRRLGPKGRLVVGEGIFVAGGADANSKSMNQWKPRIVGGVTFPGWRVRRRPPPPPATPCRRSLHWWGPRH